MRYNMLQLLKNLRSHSQGKEITDADILKWANNKIKQTGRTSKIENFKVKVWFCFIGHFTHPHHYFFVLLFIMKFYRIRAYHLEYSSLSFSVLSSQGWLIGTSSPRVKVVWCVHLASSTTFWEDEKWVVIVGYFSKTFLCSPFFFPSSVVNVDEEKRLNATYIISVTRKLGCSIFLLPEDIMEVCMLQWIFSFLFKFVIGYM